MLMFPMMNPFIPTMNEQPPTLYAILNSIVNFGVDKEDKKKIPELAKYGRYKIFDFDYPLSDKVTKEVFEIMILNKFLMRRIGYETVTSFKIALSVKLNEIMPMYNKMFDMLDGWNIFNDGEVVDRIVSEEKNSLGSSNTTDSSSNNISSTVESENISDRRYSEMPENRITDIQDGNYLTEYNYDTNTDSSTTDTSGTSSGTSSTSTTNKDNNNLIERTTRTPSDKIRLYTEFINNRNSIYTMIFKELDSLFYGLA